MIAITAILATLEIVSTQAAGSKESSSGTTAAGRYVQPSTVNWVDLAPLALLAFQSAGQVVASRILKYNELPTVVLTTAYCDLMSDPHLFTAGLLDDPQRNRRVLAAVMLFVGAVSGGIMVNGWVGLKGALWLGAALKAAMVLAWVSWAPHHISDT